MDPKGLGSQLAVLFTLAIPIACVSWTITHEEVFHEVREWFERRSRVSPRLIERKFFYLFTCEYCFSHYVTIAVLALSRFQLLIPDWRGYLLAGFSLVWIANLYMSLFGRLRLEIRRERGEIAAVEEQTGAGLSPKPRNKERG